VERAQERSTSAFRSGPVCLLVSALARALLCLVPSGALATSYSADSELGVVTCRIGDIPIEPLTGWKARVDEYRVDEYGASGWVKGTESYDVRTDPSCHVDVPLRNNNRPKCIAIWGPRDSFDPANQDTWPIEIQLPGGTDGLPKDDVVDLGARVPFNSREATIFVEYRHDTSNAFLDDLPTGPNGEKVSSVLHALRLTTQEGKDLYALRIYVPPGPGAEEMTLSYRFPCTDIGRLYKEPSPNGGGTEVPAWFLPVVVIWALVLMMLVVVIVAVRRRRRLLVPIPARRFPKRSPQPVPPPPGDALGHYEILSVISSGGDGEGAARGTILYKALDNHTSTLLAVKALREKAAASAEARARFMAEAETASKLHSPQVAQIIDRGEAPIGYSKVPVPYFVMPFYPFPSLREWLQENGPPGEELGLQFIIEMSRALVNPHAHGIAHKDLKPENVLVATGKNGHLKRLVLLDFGISSIEATGRVIGSLNYLSPEHVRKAHDDSIQVGVPADFFALGLILHELLTGRMVFPVGTPREEVYRQLLSNEPLKVELATGPESRKLELIVRKMLEKDPAQRFQDVGALLEELRSYYKERFGLYLVDINR
jgi:hypothetical protein